MKSIDPPIIPDQVVDFSKAVSDLAVQHGMERFTLTTRPNFDVRNQQHDHRIHGEMVIHFSAVDGRGRPCRNLSIQLQANLSLIIEENQSSY